MTSRTQHTVNWYYGTVKQLTAYGRGIKRARGYNGTSDQLNKYIYIYMNSKHYDRVDVRQKGKTNAAMYLF